MFGLFSNPFNKNVKLAQEICALEQIKLLDKPIPPVSSSNYAAKKTVAAWVEARFAQIVKDHYHCHSVMSKLKKTCERLCAAGIPVRIVF